MSLIIATSRLNEDETQTTNQRPSNFQNFFRSAIEIEADSEIAVDSVKIEKMHFCIFDLRQPHHPFFAHAHASGTSRKCNIANAFLHMLLVPAATSLPCPCQLYTRKSGKVQSLCSCMF